MLLRQGEATVVAGVRVHLRLCDRAVIRPVVRLRRDPEQLLELDRLAGLAVVAGHLRPTRAMAGRGREPGRTVALAHDGPLDRDGAGVVSAGDLAVGASLPPDQPAAGVEVSVPIDVSERGVSPAPGPSSAVVGTMQRPLAAPDLVLGVDAGQVIAAPTADPVALAVEGHQFVVAAACLDQVLTRAAHDDVVSQPSAHPV